MTDTRHLTRKEFDDVIRRATELSVDDPDAGEYRLDENDLFRIAEEVGLSEAHARRALTEMRAEQMAREQGAGFFNGAIVQVSRTVPGDTQEVAKAVDDFLVEWGLQRPVRTAPSLRTYKQLSGTFSDLKRSFNQNNWVTRAKGVEAQFDPLSDDSTHVQLSMDFAALRLEYIGWAWAAGLGAGGSLCAGGVVLATALGLPLLAGGALGAVVGAAAGCASVFGVREAWRRKRYEIDQEVEGILDKLETGESLKPPPPKWRRWIQDQLQDLTD